MDVVFRISSEAKSNIKSLNIVSPHCKNSCSKMDPGEEQKVQINKSFIRIHLKCSKASKFHTDSNIFLKILEVIERG